MSLVPGTGLKRPLDQGQPKHVWPVEDTVPGDREATVPLSSYSDGPCTLLPLPPSAVILGATPGPPVLTLPSLIRTPETLSLGS